MLLAVSISLRRADLFFHVFSWPRVSGSGQIHNLIGAGGLFRRSRQRVGAEGLRGDAVDHQLEIDAVIGQIDDVLFAEYRAELPRQIAGVFRAGPEGDDGAHVAEHRRSHFVVQLFDVLMGQGQAQAVFAGFRQDIGKRQGDEIVHLVHVEVVGMSPAFRQAGPAQGGQLHPRDQHRAEQGAVVFPNPAFGQIHDQDLLLVHHGAQLESVFPLADNVPQGD